MRKQKILQVSAFLILFSIIIFFLQGSFVMSSVSSAVELVLLPFQRSVTTVFAGEPDNEDKLAQAALVAKSGEDKKEMQALRDQFDNASPQASSLTPVKIVGYRGYIPGVSSVKSYVIDKGTRDGLKVGQAVVYKDNLVGVLTKVTVYSSYVSLLGDSELSFTGETASENATGVVRGTADGIIMDNIVLSEKISRGDIVVTKGDMTVEGAGLPPGLVVGEVTENEKKQSDIFQSAKLKSLIDFNSLSTVFVIGS